MRIDLDKRNKNTNFVGVIITNRKTKSVMKKDYFDLSGRVAIVTGCSTGLGVQMARALASAGCNIVPIARRLEKLEEVAAMLREEFHVEALPLRCDITSTEMVDEVVAATMAHFGRIDILINVSSV